MLCGLGEQATIDRGIYSLENCQAVHFYLTLTFNWHNLVLLHYLWFLLKVLQDPLVSNLAKELMVFIFLPAIAVALSWDSGVLKCMYQDTVAGHISLRTHSSLIHAIVFSILPVFTLPILQYLRY